MPISVQNRKLLWGRSGNKCAFPECNCELSLTGENDVNVVLGEECHIEAKSKDGPRFNCALTDTQIDSFENLILLCPTHHTIVDKNPMEYTVERLKLIKNKHEQRVRSALENKNEYDDLYYESIVVYIDSMLEFDNW